MTETTYKVVVKDPERETVTYCSYERAMIMAELAQEIEGYECSIQELGEEG